MGMVNLLSSKDAKSYCVMVEAVLSHTFNEASGEPKRFQQSSMEVLSKLNICMSKRVQRVMSSWSMNKLWLSLEETLRKAMYRALEGASARLMRWYSQAPILVGTITFRGWKEEA